MRCAVPLVVNLANVELIRGLAIKVVHKVNLTKDLGL